MRTFFSLTITFMIFILIGCEPKSSNPKYPGFTVYAQYTHINFFNTIPDYEYNMWPGQLMTHYKGDWYSFTLKEQKSASIIFNTNGFPKTAELYRETDGWFYNGKWYDSNPELMVTQLNITKSITGLKIDNQEQLYAYYSPELNINKTWSSSDNSIVKVDGEGVITGVSVGNAEITVSGVGGLVAKCLVKVSSIDIPVTTVGFSSETFLLLQQKERLLFDVSPSSATAQIFTLSSDNPSVVSITNDGVVTGLSVGSATVTVKWNENPSVSDSMLINVKNTCDFVYSDENPYIKVDFRNLNEIKYKISDALGKSAYVVKANKSLTSGIKGENVGGILNQATFQVRSGLSESIKENGFIRLEHKEAAKFNKEAPFVSRVNTSTTRSLNVIEHGESAYNLDEAKSFWVEDGSGKFVLKEAKLRGIGRYCYVWVIEKNFGAGTNQVSRYRVNELVKRFDGDSNKDYSDGIYSLVTNVFGYEYGGEPGGNGGADKDKHISILIYDIDGDYSANQDQGVLGFFWSKDFYTQSELTSMKSNIKTNLSEMFYLDANFTDKQAKMIYSTLAHEYQHMINFNVKNVEKKIRPSVWYNEMLSMVSEDIVQSYLEIDNENSPIGRLNQFNRTYYRSGVNNWLLGQEVIISYSTAYAFGAYLYRNYGGVSAISNILSNDYIDNDSIEKSVIAQGFTDYSFETIFDKYVEALMYEAPPNVGIKTFNKSVESTFNDVDYNSGPINLWSIRNESNVSEYYGPRTFSLNENVELRPLGHAIYTDKKWGNLDSDLIIELTKPESNSVDTYIVIK